jgi:uncharacterized protein (DUF302 family)
MSLSKILLTILVAFYSLSASAGELIMHRSTQTFPEAMLSLQNTIAEHGYKVSRVQRVDIGLTKSGYKTDKYRIVFFGKASELKTVKQHAPELLAYLPIKISIFAEGNETLLIALKPDFYKRFVKDEKTRTLITHWENDLLSILASVE